jgi:ATP-dependent RNA helicase DeaD
MGAIANEAGLDGKSIGRIVIRDDHSFVDLPGGMPKEVFKQLQKVRVAGQKLEISRALKTQTERLRHEHPHSHRGARKDHHKGKARRH